MLSERSALPLDLPLRPSRCLYYYLLSAHMLSLQLLVAMDGVDMGFSLFLIVILLRHYQLYLYNDPLRRFDALTYRTLTGWRLIKADARPVPVTVVSVRWLASRWALIQFLPDSSEKAPLVLVLCPDALGVEQARQLKQYLILYGRPGKEDGLLSAGGEKERFRSWRI